MCENNILINVTNNVCVHRLVDWLEQLIVRNSVYIKHRRETNTTHTNQLLQITINQTVPTKISR